MKKISLVILCIALLMTAILPVSAATATDYKPAHPKGYYDATIEHADTVNRTEFAKIAGNLGTDLSAIAYARGSSSYSSQTDLADATKKADLANTNYGISLIGGKKMDRHIKAISDGVWSEGNKKINNVPVGAGSWIVDGNFYNVAGNTNNDLLPTGDYIYNSLLTYNFGEAKKMNYMVFAQGGTSAWITGAPAAGDIYVGNEDENGNIIWELKSYWDIPQLLVEKSFDNGKMYDYAMESDLGKDRWQTQEGKDVNTTRTILVLDLNGIEGQYLRLAFTAGRGLTGYTADGTKMTADMANALIASPYEKLSNNLLDSSNAGNAQVSARDIIIYGDEAGKEEKTPTINYEGVQLSSVSDGIFDARLVASLNSTDYDIAGFEIAARYYDAENLTREATVTGTAKDHTTKKVYKSVLSVTDGITKQWTAEGDRCLIAMNVLNIPVSTHLMILTVTPFAEKDGVRTAGETYEVAFLDGVYYATNLVY